MTIVALVVDDDEMKRELVRSALEQTAPLGELRVIEARDSISAKRVLREQFCDILILDLALPLREVDIPKPLGGLELLDELIERDIYTVPPHILGLTAHKELFDDVQERFRDELWDLVFYDATSETWVEALQAKVRHIRRAKRSPNVGFQCDLAIVAALQDPELDAVLKGLPWSWQPLEIASDPTLYYRGTYFFEGQERIAYAARAPNMGMPSASILAAKLVFHFKPRCLAMPGICAGDAAEVQLGDIIVANPTWDYGAGKHDELDGTKRFTPAAFQMPLSARVRGLAERLASNVADLEGIRTSYYSPPPSVLRLHSGPMGSGAAVLGDEDKFKEVQSYHRKTIAIDMEAYGVMLAAYELPAPTPEGLVIKGVSDFANREKNSQEAQRARPYAAHASAQALRVLAEKYGL